MPDRIQFCHSVSARSLSASEKTSLSARLASTQTLEATVSFFTHSIQKISGTRDQFFPSALNHFSVANPIEQAARISGIPARSFKRRFKSATGHAPIDYVQRLRGEEAKRRLERTDAPVDEISWQVGYEDPAFFRRLFKRITGATAGAYRRKFQIPGVEIVSSD